MYICQLLSDANYLYHVVIKNSYKSLIFLCNVIIFVNNYLIDEVVDYAESNNIGLIVVGTRGRSGFKKLLLGSVASGIVTYAHCPVMVVK